MPFQQLPQMDFSQLEADRVKALEQTPQPQPDRLPAYSEAIMGRHSIQVVEKAKKQELEQEQKSQSNGKKSGKLLGLKSIFKGDAK